MRESACGERVATRPRPALLVLLLVLMVVCEVGRAESRPVDFVCNRGSRRRAMHTVAEMETELHQEKRADIIASLGLLSEDMQAARPLTPPGCVSALLQRLEHSITNYQHILTHLELSGAAESPLNSCSPRSTTSLSTVLWAYSRLITGKLEWLVVTLEDRCRPAP
ncbi:hypothetical protein N1851_028645 [Merluccius polli]|uniref:Ciliary neurotrophic factor n=1 Tax=Merluccius polli TaxID=89951 RepID=A0AA47M8C8_MERPO|nr:hypothetical protein N1851_028645 [Merluccius polli]